MTPHLVGLARKLEGRPFHLVAAHCQRAPKEDVVAYVRSQGLAEDTPNLTVSSFGGHPGVQGNGHVPYYMVFDHTGKLRHHHMGGAYHGGDGLAQIEWVETLLDETPDIWLGQEPFLHLPDLAEKVAARRDLGGVLRRLDEEIAGEDESRAGDARRLRACLTTWRDRQLAVAEQLLATEPDEILDRLRELAKELRGSDLAEPLRARVDALDGSPELRAAISIQKTLEKLRRKIERLQVPKAARRRGLEVFDLDDAECREAQRRTLERSAKKLREAVEGHEDLPIARTALAYAARLEG